MILGKFNFVASCVRQSRIFISRLLKFLRTLLVLGKVGIPVWFKNDLLWWYHFLLFYSGVSTMAIAEWSRPDKVFSTYACLVGCGGWSADRRYFHTSFPEAQSKKGLHINGLELLTIVVACKTLGDKWAGKRIVVQCDNELSVWIINTGKTRDHFMKVA